MPYVNYVIVNGNVFVENPEGRLLCPPGHNLRWPTRIDGLKLANGVLAIALGISDDFFRRVIE